MPKIIKLATVCSCGSSEYIEKDGQYLCAYCRTLCKEERIPPEDKQIATQARSDREIWKFDDALDRYETLLADHPDNPDFNWGALLSYYGFTFEKDSDGKLLPNCHRAIRERIYDCKYFAHLDKACQAKVPELEALRQEIIREVDAIDDNYDVFLSFKSGGKDEVAAGELYHHLHDELGVKVFFSRVCLAGVTGNYEPHIYSALRKAKLMLVLASSKDNLESAWVKNEWKRFLAFGKESGDKTIVPVCLEGMSPSSLPPELAKLQAVSLTSLHAKDTIDEIVKRFTGAKKVELVKKKQIASVDRQPAMMGEEQTLARAKEYLNKGNFHTAMTRAQGVLKENPSSAGAYEILFLVSLQISDWKQLETKPIDFATAKKYENFDRLYALTDTTHKEFLLKWLLRFAMESKGKQCYPFIEDYLSYGDETIHICGKDFYYSSLFDILNQGMKSSAEHSVEERKAFDLLMNELLNADVNDYRVYFARYLLRHGYRSYGDIAKTKESFIDDEDIELAARGYSFHFPAQANVFDDIEMEIEDLKESGKDDNAIDDLYRDSPIDLKNIHAFLGKEGKERQQAATEVKKQQARHYYGVLLDIGYGGVFLGLILQIIAISVENVAFIVVSSLIVFGSSFFLLFPFFKHRNEEEWNVRKANLFLVMTFVIVILVILLIIFNANNRFGENHWSTLTLLVAPISLHIVGMFGKITEGKYYAQFEIWLAFGLNFVYDILLSVLACTCGAINSVSFGQNLFFLIPVALLFFSRRINDFEWKNFPDWEEDLNSAACGLFIVFAAIAAALGGIANWLTWHGIGRFFLASGIALSGPSLFYLIFYWLPFGKRRIRHFEGEKENNSLAKIKSKIASFFHKTPTK